jgi:hypothetical protein
MLTATPPQQSADYVPSAGEEHVAEHRQHASRTLSTLGITPEELRGI